MLRAKTYAAVVLSLVMPVSLIGKSLQGVDQHHKHQQGVNERGDHAMGFSHEKTTHHFRLTAEGGVIEVTSNDPNDTTSLEQIKSHLSHVAKMFKDGNFSAPMFVHGETPAGVPALKKLKGAISYTFVSIDHGGSVRISTRNPEAIEAIHEFLIYQIKEHQTGDSLESEKKAQTGTERACGSMHEGTCPMASRMKSDNKK